MISLKVLLDRLHPDYKKRIALKLYTVTKVLNTEINTEGILPMEECFRLLGITEIQLLILEEIISLSRDYFNYVYIRTQIKEIEELSALYKNMRNTLTKMIKGHIQESTKDFAFKIQ